jgi:hypothetical protein
MSIIFNNKRLFWIIIFTSLLLGVSQTLAAQLNLFSTTSKAGL